MRAAGCLLSRVLQGLHVLAVSPACLDALPGFLAELGVRAVCLLSRVLQGWHVLVVSPARPDTPLGFLAELGARRRLLHF